MPHVLPGSGTCVVLAGGRCCREYSSADGRIGPGRAGGPGAMFLTVTGSCAEDSQLESADSVMSLVDIFDTKELLGSTD